MKFKLTLWTLVAPALAMVALAWVATDPARAQQQKAPQPQLLACGAQGNYEILCGAKSPEDLEITPDGKYLLVSQFVRNGGGGIALFDPGKKTYAMIVPTDEPLRDWGDSACPGPIGDKVAPHGTSLVKRNNGKWQLFVVNHGGRESIEMYELKQTGGNWGLVWHGCVTTTGPQAYNDVAALADGGYVATHPTALQAANPQAKGGGGADLFAGAPSGYVGRWVPGKGETELPDSRAGYPNGVVADPNGRTAYFAAWTAKEIHKYDLKENKQVGVIKLDFMPDNITWTKKNQLIAAGVTGARGDCPPGSGTPCTLSFGIAEIDPGKFTAKQIFNSEGKGALITGVSVALEVGNSIYVGAFSGDRLLKIPAPK
jgi:hypothetical protein